MATENPVKHGDFGDEGDRGSRPLSYDKKAGTSPAKNLGAHPEHSETARPVKGDTFSKR